MPAQATPPTLPAAGGSAAPTGLALAWLITLNRQACAATAKFSGAAQALTAAMGLGLIGALLTNAGRDHRRPCPSVL